MDSPVTASFRGSIFDSTSEGSGPTLIQAIPTTKTKPVSLPFTLHTPRQLLWKAVLEGNSQVCQELLQTFPGLDLNRFFLPQDLSLLHKSCAHGDLQTSQVLLDYASNIDLSPKDRQLQTPLHLASQLGHYYIVQLLVRSGAELNPQNIEGNTPLHLASMYGRIQVVQWLLSKSPDIFLRNERGQTAESCTQSSLIREIFRSFKRKHRVGLQTKYSKLQAGMKQIPIGAVCADDFEISMKLGSGSFGNVYLVTKKSTNKQYAMKVLNKKLFIEKNIVKYAVTERNILSYVKHPLIIQLKYAFQTSEKLALIMDYCPGGDLGAHLARHKTFPEWLAKVYLCEVLLALEELHRNDILFRDLKPENILLDQEGHIQLIDFGLSKESVSEKHITSSFCGSTAYLAPEIIGRKGHGRSVDWYLLGVLFYEMLIGVPPYFSKRREELFKNIQTGTLKLPKKMSEKAKSLLTGLLERNPQKRLGYEHGAQEIKNHEYFRGVNWEQVLRKELKPIKPFHTKIMHQSISPTLVFGESGNREINKLAGWTFVSEH